MKYVLDAHTHTIVSGHAYSTIREMATVANKRGLELLCITEHAPALIGSCTLLYFQNLKVIEKDDYDVPILLGVEVNILDELGTIDMEQDLLETMDVVIASFHPPCIRNFTKEELTGALVTIMQNPFIHIIGHPDDGRYPLDYEVIAKVAKETNTLLEVNNSSLLPTSFRSKGRENYIEMLKACMKFKTHIILNSDAHVDTHVGRRDMSMALLEEVGFPDELVVNTSVDKFKKFLHK